MTDATYPGLITCGRHLAAQGLLSPIDQRHVDLFERFLDGERSHEVVAWALGEPMSSANDPQSCGMGC